MASMAEALSLCDRFVLTRRRLRTDFFSSTLPSPFFEKGEALPTTFLDRIGSLPLFLSIFFTGGRWEFPFLPKLCILGTASSSSSRFFSFIKTRPGIFFSKPPPRCDLSSSVLERFLSRFFRLRRAFSSLPPLGSDVTAPSVLNRPSDNMLHVFFLLPPVFLFFL